MAASIIHWKRKRSIGCVPAFCGNSRRKKFLCGDASEAEDGVLFIEEEQKIGGAFEKVSVHIADDECSSN